MKRRVMSLVIIFFGISISEIVHKEFILTSQTVKSAYYCDFLGECVEMCEDFAPNFDDKRPGYYTTKMHSFSPRNSLPKTT
jgi:hypothetical protein